MDYSVDISIKYLRIQLIKNVLRLGDTLRKQIFIWCGLNSITTLPKARDTKNPDSLHLTDKASRTDYTQLA